MSCQATATSKPRRPPIRPSCLSPRGSCLSPRDGRQAPDGTAEIRLIEPRIGPTQGCTATSTRRIGYCGRRNKPAEPRDAMAPGDRGTRRASRLRGESPLLRRSAVSFSASPTANPVGMRKRVGGYAARGFPRSDWSYWSNRSGGWAAVGRFGPGGGWWRFGHPWLRWQHQITERWFSQWRGRG